MNAVRDPRHDQAGPFTVHVNDSAAGAFVETTVDTYLEALEIIEELPSGVGVALTAAPDFPRSPMYLDSKPPYDGTEPK